MSFHTLNTQIFHSISIYWYKIVLKDLFSFNYLLSFHATGLNLAMCTTKIVICQDQNAFLLHSKFIHNKILSTCQLIKNLSICLWKTMKQINDKNITTDSNLLSWVPLNAITIASRSFATPTNACNMYLSVRLW